MNIGMKIKELRNKKNITVTQIADALKVSEQAIYKYEANKAEPSLSSLMKLAEIFGISVTSLLDENSNDYTNGLDETIIKVLREQNADLRREIEYLKSQNERLLVKY